MDPLIKLHKVKLSPPSEGDKRADEQRISDALGMELEIPVSVLRKVHLYTGDGLSCVVGRDRDNFRLIDIAAASSFSIALDIGTTNLAALLYDNVSGKVVSEVKVENPQITFGSDILTRMHHAMLDKEEEVCRHLMEGVNTVIKKLCDDAGISGQDIHALVAAGNTVMSHFFLGLDVSSIPVAPFVPVVRKPGFFNAAELRININPEALVYVFPNAGSYVGGDIIAGIIVSGMFDSDEVSVLIDVGTNAEIVIGNKDWLLAGAGAAGPALEEGIAGIGKRAESGIIYDVEIRGGDMECRTFNDAPPEGICGSGMVSLIYEMYSAGIIGNDGILDPEHKGVDVIDGVSAYMIPCASGSGLFIKQTEIDNFLRSKAAMFTLLLVMLRSVGLSFGDIRRVYVAGALGNGIDARKASGIGMLPAWSPDVIVPLGNASLKGAQMILEDGGLLARADEITDSITYKHMHDDPEFMKEFRGAIFIPHTNPDILKVQ
jgi:uncharacterized 2Fe-2S/4Fe-4S cluster protein (DUF4445 family)